MNALAVIEVDSSKISMFAIMFMVCVDGSNCNCVVKKPTRERQTDRQIYRQIDRQRQRKADLSHVGAGFCIELK